MNPTNIKCTYRAARRSSQGCYQDAVLAAKTIQWSMGKPAEFFAPRCKRHAASERSKRYLTIEIVDITPAILATWQEAAKYTERLAAEDLVEYEVVRDDEKDESWAVLRGERDPRPTPRWFVSPVGAERRDSWNSIEVKVTSGGNRPPRLKVRNFSSLTPRAAAMFADALALATAEALFGPVAKG